MGASSTQAIMMQAAPGGAHMPQLALQQYSPGGQMVLPQTSPPGSGGSQ
jgi:hypothetical protein